MKQIKQWRSRIVGHDSVDPETLTANPKNHRVHPEQQRKVVRDSISELGFVKSILVNKTTGFVVDGHERLWQALEARKADPTLKVDVEYIELDEKDEAKALAVLDASTGLALVDESQLEMLMQEIETDSENIRQLMKDMSKTAIELPSDNKQLSETYTAKVDVPPYTPREQNPNVEDVFDSEKTKALIKEICETDLPDNEREFLIAAAYRHVVFDFEKIADRYAHADPTIQRLMENSALVIVDVDKAIESGWTRASSLLSELYPDEE